MWVISVSWGDKLLLLLCNFLCCWQLQQQKLWKIHTTFRLAFQIQFTHSFPLFFLFCDYNISHFYIYLILPITILLTIWWWFLRSTFTQPPYRWRTTRWIRENIKIPFMKFRVSLCWDDCLFEFFSWFTCHAFFVIFILLLFLLNAIMKVFIPNHHAIHKLCNFTAYCSRSNGCKTWIFSVFIRKTWKTKSRTQPSDFNKNW